MKVNVLFERAKDGYYSCFMEEELPDLDWPATEIQRKRLRLIF